MIVDFASGKQYGVKGREGDGRLSANYGRSRVDVSKIFALHDRDIMSWLRCSPFGITQDQDMISWDQKCTNKIMFRLRY